jgi:hypothetical protein
METRTRASSTTCAACTDCRAERLRLEDGVATLAYATHETAPPDELRDHVLAVLDEEWHSDDEDPQTGATVVPMRHRSPCGGSSAWRLRSC